MKYVTKNREGNLRLLIFR